MTEGLHENSGALDDENEGQTPNGASDGQVRGFTIVDSPYGTTMYTGGATSVSLEVSIKMPEEPGGDAPA